MLIWRVGTMLFSSHKMSGTAMFYFPAIMFPRSLTLFSTKDRTGNCRAGFVADQGVSHPVTVDFYLQSHAAVKGSGCPVAFPEMPFAFLTLGP